MAPKAQGTRAWLILRDDERRPVVIEADEPTRVVWSSLWVERPDDRVALHVAPDGESSTLEFVWMTVEKAPSESTTRHIRRRLSEILFRDLRFSYGN